MSLTTKRLSPTHRLSITEIELQALTSILDSMRSMNNNKLSPELAAIRRKCKNLIEKILTGEKLPDYIPGDRVKAAGVIGKISLEMLGEKEETYKLESSYDSGNKSDNTLKDNIHALINDVSISNPASVLMGLHVRANPAEPSDDEFAAAELELQEAIACSKTARMTQAEWEEQRKLYPFLPEIQPD